MGCVEAIVAGAVFLALVSTLIFGIHAYAEHLAYWVRRRRQRRHPADDWERAYATPEPALLATLTQQQLEQNLHELSLAVESISGTKEQLTSYVFHPEQGKQFSMEFLLSPRGGVGCVWIEDIWSHHRLGFTEGELRRICRQYGLDAEYDSMVSAALSDVTTGLLIRHREQLLLYPHLLAESFAKSPFAPLAKNR